MELLQHLVIVDSEKESVEDFLFVFSNVVPKGINFFLVFLEFSEMGLRLRIMGKGLNWSIVSGFLL